MYWKQGRVDEAIALLEQSVLLKKQIQGSNHPDTESAIAMLDVWRSLRDEKTTQ